MTGKAINVLLMIALAGNPVHPQSMPEISLATEQVQGQDCLQVCRLAAGTLQSVSPLWI